MGINGLFPLLKSIHKPCNLKKFEGKTIGVDAYGWLHRGTVSCALELAMGKPTRKFVEFSMHRVRMLQHFGVTPFLIFDGDYLPSKAATEADRAKRREDSKRAGLELLNAGKTSQAYLEFQKAVDVTPEMARQLIDELKKASVQYIVAPYEADAQMVYLERKGILDGILSEDSDLLVFGAKCLLTKLDQYGNCIEINKADFCACKEISLTGWSDVEFRRMAILSGCDYLSSINNMGLKTAYRMIRKHKTIEKVLRMLSFDGKFFVPKGYLEAFYQAEHTFLHQRVFCPEAGGLVFHTEPEQPIDHEAMPFIGAFVEPEIAQGVARGDLSPITKLPIVVEKRGNMAVKSPVTPWTTSKVKSQLSASSNNLKKGKIDTLFKPKRIPLAELDINCFTPSPSQQDALRRNPGSWDPSPARPYLSRAATRPQAPQSGPAPLPPVGRTHTRTSTISEPRPPKRARLCEDNDLLDLPRMDQRVNLNRSRFFGTNTAEPSPTVGKSSRSRRLRKENITIFSDDSIEDVMLNLPDLDGFTNEESRTLKVPIFQEESQKAACEPYLPGPSPVSDEASISQGSDIGLTPSMSLTSSFEQGPPTPTESEFSSNTTRELKSRFSFVAGVVSTPKSSVVINGYPTPVSSHRAQVISASSRPSRIPLAIKSNVPAPKGSATTARPSLTPLQRLGAHAASRSKLPMTPPSTGLCSMKRSSPRRSILSKGSVPFPEVVSQTKSQLLEPASIPLPVADEIENAALMQTGSEDLIVHDSEEEECSPVASEAPRMDFRRFVFAG